MMTELSDLLRNTVCDVCGEPVDAWEGIFDPDTTGICMDQHPECERSWIIKAVTVKLDVSNF